MIKQLIKLANHLDAKGLSKEADYLDAVITKIAGCPSEPDDTDLGTMLEEEMFYAENLWDMHREMDQEEDEQESLVLDLTDN